VLRYLEVEVVLLEDLSGGLEVFLVGGLHVLEDQFVVLRREVSHGNNLYV
jgi:hypothetical protein